MKYFSFFVLFLMFVIPNSFTSFKIFIFPLYLISYAVFNFKSSYLTFSKFYLYVVYFSALNLLFIFWGLINGASINAVFANTKLLVIYPVLSLFFLKAFSRYITFSNFISISLASVTYISFFGFLLFFEIIFNIKLIPDFISNNMTIINDASSGGFRLNYIGLNSLFFLLPVSMSTLFNKSISKKSFILISLILIIALVIILVSGRRALFITTVLSPLLILTYLINLKYLNVKKFFIVLVPLFLMFIYFFYEFFSFQAELTGSDVTVLNRITNILKDDIRVTQAYFLLDYFVSHPWGSGFGVVLPDSEIHIRDAVSKWNFELTYLQLLCNIGIIGFAFYISIFFSLFKKMKKIAKNHDYSYFVIGILCGLQLLLVASFTNPYISSFEYIFILFLPVYILFNQKNIKI